MTGCFAQDWLFDLHTGRIAMPCITRGGDGNHMWEIDRRCVYVPLAFFEDSPHLTGPRYRSSQSSVSLIISFRGTM